MKKVFFFVSDIHSFYTPLIKALNKHGFDINNQDHVLVVLGDVFDRGNETLEVYNFLKSIPKERLILIRGNHELLFIELLSKRFPESYDFSNGTVRTFCQIAGFDEKYLDIKYWFKLAYLENKEPYEYFDMPYDYWKQVKETIVASDVNKWIQSDEWINYFETPNYIFVHSWIPVGSHDGLPAHYLKNRNFEYREDWRNATQTEWEDSTWGCPWMMTKLGLNKTNKTIVCGHWHTSDFFNHLTKQRKGKYECPLFKSKKWKLIGLDACTVASDKINVLVLNEDEL